MYILGAGSRNADAPDQAASSPELGQPAPPALGVMSQKWRVRLLRAEVVDDVFTGAPLPCAFAEKAALEQSLQLSSSLATCIASKRKDLSSGMWL